MMLGPVQNRELVLHLIGGQPTFQYPVHLANGHRSREYVMFV
jgi:hypothetical protein